MTTFRAIAVSHRGMVRDRNEDCVGAAGWRGAGQECAVEVRPLDGAPAVAVVADGVGGHPGGDVASRTVVAHLLEQAGSVRTAEELAESVTGAGHRLEALMDERPDLRGMASTVAALVLTSEAVLIANVGDSRIYELHGGELLRLSIDDAPAERAGGGVLTQVLGGYPPASAVHPHVSRLQREPGLRFLLCSDGLTDALDEQSVEAIVAERAPDWQAAALALVRGALDRGATDNVTLAIVVIDDVEDRG